MKDARWHKKPTAMLGGVAIYLAVTVSFLLFVPHTREGWVVMGASTALFVVGLVDDFLHIKPYQKLIGQVLGATAVVYFGLLLPWGWAASVGMAVTIFWLIGITNAINLLDNMDGLAAGVSAIAAVFIAASFAVNGQLTEAAMLSVFAAALVGFLVFNTNPASIFMGDCGSMFVGFFLASSALLSASGERGRSFIVVIAVPVLILFIPVLIFVKMSSLLVSGVYRGLWRYISVDNLIVYAKAVVAGSVASVLALLFAFRFEGFSRAVFVLDSMIFFLALAGSRVAFRLFRQLLPAPSAGGRRVLIYGAGDAGELLLREMRNNLQLQYTPVGFVDDDPRKKGRVLHGLRVFGGNGQLRRVCDEQRVEEVLISSTKITDERLREILRDCEEAQITLKRMRIEIELVGHEF